MQDLQPRYTNVLVDASLKIFVSPYCFTDSSVYTKMMVLSERTTTEITGVLSENLIDHIQAVLIE